MYICENCFNDSEIQTYIRSLNKKGNCDICGARDVFVGEIDEFEDFFSELLSLFQQDNKGKDITSLIQDDWNIFSNRDIASSVLKYFIKNFAIQYGLKDKVNYISQIDQYTNKWKDLKEEIRTKARFNSSLMRSFDDKDSVLNSNLLLRAGTKFYRARIVPPGKSYLTKKDMGCPPPMKATAGRANPLGIPYLYLCKAVETTLYETRSVYLDRVTIGTFSIKRDLSILDFTSSISLYVAYNLGVALVDTIAKHRLRQLISADLSKPLRRYDTELEYVPTQSVCEYCKLKGIDGIIFRSSLHENGYNLVLFDENNAECLKAKTVEVRKVEISI